MAAQDNQEAYTRVLDLNAQEIYTRQNYLPTSSLPSSGSSQHLDFITANIGEEDVNIAQYFYEVTCSRSEKNFGGGKSEVWYTISGSGYDPVAVNNGAGVNSTVIESLQQTNWLSNKYASSSLALNNAESSTPGYNVLVKKNGININSLDYQFDYKTGVLEFVSNLVSPSTTDKVTVTGYRYVGQTLDQFITGDSGGGTPGGSPGEIQFNDGGAFGGDPRFIFEKTTGLTKLSGSLQITGSTDNIFLIKSGSIDLLRVSSSGAIVFGDLQHTPPPVAGGFFYSSSAFYVGVE